jgi:hypothetical protein
MGTCSPLLRDFAPSWHSLFYIVVISFNMNRINPDMDIVALIIAEVRKAKPEDEFCKSIQLQYAERGGLSKKQLQGLHGKAQRIDGIHPGRLATLEAIIKKKHTTERTPAALTTPVIEKDERVGEMISAILEKYPAHKRVIYLDNIYKKDGILQASDIVELEKFFKLLIK